jgi:hypothetical protein
MLLAQDRELLVDNAVAVVVQVRMDSGQVLQ